MYAHFAKVIRASIALQVATLELENSEIGVSDDEAAKAVKVCLKELEKAAKAMIKECT